MFHQYRNACRFQSEMGMQVPDPMSSHPAIQGKHIRDMSAPE
jgi:hypothetical protein